MREALWAADGERDRSEAAYRRTAWAVSYLLNIQLEEKHRVTPEQLLRGARQEEKSPEERKREHEELVKRFGASYNAS